MSMESGSIIIVTRHTGLVEWLARRGYVGEVVGHVTANDVEGQHIFGNIPLSLAALAATVTTVDMPDLRPDQRGQDLSPAEMDAAGATLNTYTVFNRAEADRVAEAIASTVQHIGYHDAAKAAYSAAHNALSTKETDPYQNGAGLPRPLTAR